MSAHLRFSIGDEVELLGAAGGLPARTRGVVRSMQPDRLLNGHDYGVFFPSLVDVDGEQWAERCFDDRDLALLGREDAIA